MKTLKQNLLKETSGIIVHGVNCQGTMGAGIALVIKNKYPKVYSDYIDFINKYSKGHETNHWLLSKVVYTEVHDKLIIASAFTQYSYGNNGQRYVSYDALDHAFKNIADKSRETGLSIKFPMIGAGLGGGNWNIISTIIEENLKDLDYCLYKL